MGTEGGVMRGVVEGDLGDANLFMIYEWVCAWGNTTAASRDEMVVQT